MMSDLVTIDIKLPDFIKGDDIIVNTADADIVANDVVKDKIAYGANGKVVGTFEGVDTSDADATAGDIVKDKTAYVGGIKIVGTHECSGGTLTDGYVPKILSTELVGWDVYVNELHTVCLPDVERNNVFTIDFHESSAGAIQSYADNAFARTVISSFTIHNGVSAISDGCFKGCYSIGAMTIPSNITSIGKDAFNGCTALSEIHFTRNVPPTVDTNAFANIGDGCLIYVPTGTVDAYKETANMPDPETYIYTEE